MIRHILLIPLSISLALPSTASFACGKAEADAVVAKWAEVFVDDNPDRILALYAPNGVLWGTLSPKIRQGQDAIRDYFVAAFKALPGHKVTFGEQLVRTFGDTTVNSGYYTFSFTKDGETKSLPARYSFTFTKGEKGCVIVDHHSSAVPAPPPS
jgi:uncharacterized protein (TIGR02246 family)